MKDAKTLPQITVAKLNVTDPFRWRRGAGPPGRSRIAAQRHQRISMLTAALAGLDEAGRTT